MGSRESATQVKHYYFNGSFVCGYGGKYINFNNEKLVLYAKNKCKMCMHIIKTYTDLSNKIVNELKQDFGIE